MKKYSLLIVGKNGVALSAKMRNDSRVLELFVYEIIIRLKYVSKQTVLPWGSSQGKSIGYFTTVAIFAFYHIV